MMDLNYTIDDPNDFVRIWNNHIQKYGHISLYTVKAILMIDSEYKDISYFWICKISVKDNFRIVYYKNYVRFRLNLPEPKHI